MSDMGLAEFSHSVEFLDAQALTDQFLEMERRRGQLRRVLLAHNAMKAEMVERQFQELDEVLFDQGSPSRVAGVSAPAFVGQDTA